ncbi:hypothetical protein C0Q70_05798 [Pomacea canaliculata]|uniref:Gastrin/cholecystokinin type B receptor n=2 Tax=Pomacea canaliculata TaxID=400727 RepID=A0A2T7PM78_POMCA|nr:hypothetical protein C0Q70_05798 [Pomacea canaliculata]
MVYASTPPPEGEVGRNWERDQCEKMYNKSTALAIEQLAFANASMEQFVAACIGNLRSAGLSFFVCIPYAFIFLLSVGGNSLVILTLVRHKKMRTITNMLLLNLAVSDLLLAVFCMPFTLIPMLMKAFIFGPVICVLIRYLQAVSVSVSCFTLVVISIERFFAICQPLRSRSWQTLKHSYRVLLMIWAASFLLMVPIAVFTKVITLDNGHQACREIWPSHLLEMLYAALLDVVLFAMPLLLMAVSYTLVARQLWSAANFVVTGSPTSENGENARSFCDATDSASLDTPMTHSPLIPRNHEVKDKTRGHYHGQGLLRLGKSAGSNGRGNSSNGTSSMSSQAAASVLGGLRPAYYNRVLNNKRRVVKMLCVVVLEYFLCWGPLYALSTWTVLDYHSMRRHVTSSHKSAILLLAYLSSCIHPITYCFMNKRFRQSFASAFRLLLSQGPAALPPPQ